MLNPYMIQQGASERVQKLQNKAKSVNTVDGVVIDISRLWKLFERKEVKLFVTDPYLKKLYN